MAWAKEAKERKKHRGPKPLRGTLPGRHPARRPWEHGSDRGTGWRNLKLCQVCLDGNRGARPIAHLRTVLAWKVGVCAAHLVGPLRTSVELRGRLRVREDKVGSVLWQTMRLRAARR